MTGVRLLHGREVRQGLVHTADPHQVRHLVELAVCTGLRTRRNREQGEQDQAGEEGREQSGSHRGQKVGLCHQNRSDTGGPSRGRYFTPSVKRVGMISSGNQSDPIAVAIGVVLTAVALYLLLTPRTRFGQHLPLPLHPASPRPGTVREWPEGLRSLGR